MLVSGWKQLVKCREACRAQSTGGMYVNQHSWELNRRKEGAQGDRDR